MLESSAESVPPFSVWDALRYIFVAVAAGALIWYYGFSTPTIYVDRETTGETMGTHYVIKAAQFPENADWQKVATTIQHRLDALDQMMSTYRHDSEVCRFNSFSSTEDWFPVSYEIASVVQTALEISHLTEGAFDITVAPLVDLWGFGAGKHQAERQSRSFEELKSASVHLKEQIGYEKLFVQMKPPALKKGIPELTIDLSAVAKGFAVDCIAELLEEQKITNYLIEIGGEVRSKGKKSKDKDWIVGIEKPILESSKESSNHFPGLQQTRTLRDESLATSGNYRQTLQVDEQKVSHVIDPRTGLPVQVENGAKELVSVAVVVPTCSHADAWATAMFVLGKQMGMELANRHSIAVLFMLRNGSEVAEFPSKAWQK